MSNHRRYVGAKNHKITMNADINLTPSLAVGSHPTSSIQHPSHGLNYRNSELVMLTSLQTDRRTTNHPISAVDTLGSLVFIRCIISPAASVAGRGAGSQGPAPAFSFRKRA